jgi:hypothetical protein
MEQSLKERIPLYSINRIEIGTISLEEAKAHVKAGEMLMTSKGRGRNHRYTSARWTIVRYRFEDWQPRDSGGYLVLQLGS